MEVKTGYKQTEVGVIPVDWDTLSIGKSMRLINGRAFKPEDWKEIGLPIIRIQNLNDPVAIFNYFTGVVENKNLVESGDLLFAWSGTTGTSFGARIWNGPTGVLNQHIFKVIPNQKILTLEYAKLVLLKVQEQIEKESHGFKASFVHVKKSDLIAIQLPLPLTLEEQEAIAAALSDADGLIESLEKCIAKKRQIKHGAMQELLTGNRRLPGFSGEWETKFLPEVCLFRDGKAHEQYISEFGKYVCVNSKFISTDGRERKYSSANFCIAKKSDILMVMSDLPNGRALAKAYMVDQDDVYAVNQRVCCLRSFRDCPEFLFFKLNRNPYFLKFDDGVNQTHLLNRVFQKCQLLLPPTLAEQHAIAATLTDMEAEIAALEAKLAKSRQVKQGMMQELLTGRIRLV